MPRRRYSRKLAFPFKGLNENLAYQDQPDGTTVDAQNVRPYPADTSNSNGNSEAQGRARGGQRPGLKKLASGSFATSSPSIQGFDHITWSDLTPLFGEGHAIMGVTSGGSYMIVDKEGTTVATGGVAGETFGMAVWGPDGYGYVATIAAANKLLLRKVNRANTVKWDWNTASMPVVDTSAGANRPVLGMDVEGKTLYVWMANISGINGQVIYRINTDDGKIRETTSGDGTEADLWKRSENQSTGNFEDFYPSSGHRAQSHNLMAISRGVIGMLVLNNSGTASTSTNKTAVIAYDASASTIQTALRDIGGLSSANVSVSGGDLPDTDCVITYAGNRANQDVVDLIPLTDAAPNQLVGRNETQRVTITGTPTGGTFTLSFTSGSTTQTTASIAHNASATVVKAALEQLPLVAQNEKQILTIASGTPSSGNFKLNFNDGSSTQKTAAINYNASASDVKTALEALSNCDEVTCSGGALPGTGITIEFTGAVVRAKNFGVMTVSDSTLDAGTGTMTANQDGKPGVTCTGGALPSAVTIEFSGDAQKEKDLTQMTATNNLTGGTTPAVTVTTVTEGYTATATITHVRPGHAEKSEIQNLAVRATAGRFTLTFDACLSLQLLSVETGNQLACKKLQDYGDRPSGGTVDATNQEMQLTVDELGNFYALTRKSDDDASTWVHAITKLSPTLTTLWQQTNAGVTRSISYDYHGSRLVAAGSNVHGSGKNFATFNLSTGAVIAEVDAWEDSPESIATWNGVAVAHDGSIRLFRNNASNNIGRLTPAATPVEDWLVSAGGASQMGTAVAGAFALNPSNTLSVRQTKLFAFAGGQVRELKRSETDGTWDWGDVTGADNPASRPLDAGQPVIFSASVGKYLFFADGRNHVYYDTPNGEIKTWEATAGTLPEDSKGNKPRLIERWRGRVVLSGVQSDPQEWYMSKLNDPFNFDYAPEAVTEDQAAAGANNPAGKMADVITAIIPYNDDIIVFGGDHSIWQITGDPMMGGRWDQLTDVTGIAWGRAWCRDPLRMIYFFGSRGGVWRAGPQGQLERLTYGVIDRRLEEIDMDNTLVRMAWNDRAQGVHVFATPLLRGQAATHYFFDVRTASWWIDKFASADMNPKAVHTFDGDAKDDRVLMIGSWDGYARHFDSAAKDDDGTAIASHVYLGPVQSSDINSQVMLDEVQCILANGSSNATCDVYVGDTVEEAYNKTSSLSQATFSAGRNKSERRMARGRAIFLKLGNTAASEAWALEQIHCNYGELGRRFSRIH